VHTISLKYSELYSLNNRFKFEQKINISENAKVSTYSDNHDKIIKEPKTDEG
jgi:hypothetical protein